MIRSVLLVAAMLALAEGAALVRFINTVPTRTAQESVAAAAADTTVFTPVSPLGNPAAAGAVGSQGITDRVGLQYFSEASSTITSPTLVWTTILNTAEQTGTAPYAWAFAMPPLRAYHTLKTATAEAVGIDKPFGSRQATGVAAATNNNWDVAMADVYEQTRLRADGVGLYLSFAAGTYRMQAYAVLSSTSSEGNTGATRVFQDSSVSFTFADNKVYTIIAYGQGKYSESTVLNGNNVRLTLLEESTASTPFGLASIRFFNAFANTASSMDVYTGTGVSDAGRLASGVAVGSVTPYFDVTPGISKEFPIAVAGSTANYLASSTAVQRDLRAGSRTTVICGVTNEASPVGFCRGIPSRAVAYVRLIHDAAGQDALVQGQFGAQKLSQTKLSLFASYDVPRPEIVAEESQVQGTSVVTSHPATQEGLYPVVINVNPGTVSGYGEVHVPLFIMDYAVRSVISRPWSQNTAAANTLGAAVNEVDYSATSTNYFFAPLFKRVHYVIKTDGYATLSARTTATGANDIFVSSFVGTSQVGKLGASNGAATNTANLAGYVTLDEYVEAGEFYSVFATAANADTTTSAYAYERSDILQVYYRRDRSVDTQSSGIQSGRGVFNFVVFGGQSYVTGTSFSIQQTATNTVATNLVLATIGADLTQRAATTPLLLADTSSAETTLLAGAYTFSYSGGTAANCIDRMPTSTASFTITEGTITDLFVLNRYGCRNNNNDVQRLAVVIQQRTNAAATGHAPATILRSSEDAKRHPAPLAL